MGWLDGKKIVDAVYGDSYTPLIQKIYKGNELIFERKDPWVEEDLFLVENISDGGAYYTIATDGLANPEVVGSDICHGFGIEFALNDTDVITPVDTSLSFFQSVSSARPYIRLDYNKSDTTFGTIPAKNLRITGGSNTGLTTIYYEITLGKKYKLEYRYAAQTYVLSDEDKNIIETLSNAVFSPMKRWTTENGVLFGTISDTNGFRYQTSGTIDYFRFYRLVDSE